MKKNNEAKVITWLPIFTGFYETIWAYDEDSAADIIISDCASDIERSEIIDWMCLGGVDYERYELDIAKSICNHVLKHYPFIKKHKFKKLNKPQFYNFKTDSIDVIVYLDLHEFHKSFFPHIKLFAEYLKENYTSCDGFLSFYSNRLEDWLIETEGFTKLDGHYLGAVMEFMYEYGILEELNEEQVTESDIYDNVFTDISLLDYIDWDGLINKFPLLKHDRDYIIL